jgi:hypothetical protein
MPFFRAGSGAVSICHGSEARLSGSLNKTGLKVICGKPGLISGLNESGFNLPESIFMEPTCKCGVTCITPNQNHSSF